MTGDLVVVRTFPGRGAALVAQAALRAHGIPSVLSGGDAGGMLPSLAFLHGIHLSVRAADADAARQVLEGAPGGAPPAAPPREPWRTESDAWDAPDETDPDDEENEDDEDDEDDEDGEHDAPWR